MSQEAVDWLRVEQAQVKRLDPEQIRQEQRAWKNAQRHSTDADPPTRIILHRQAPSSMSSSFPAEEEKEALLSPNMAARPDALQHHRTVMTQQIEDETLELRRIIATASIEARQGGNGGKASEVDDERLPPTSSSLLGVFSPHLVSHHLPDLHSYPVFHFGRDAYQPHMASCYTLNQVHQLLHRIAHQQSSSPSNPLPVLSYAYIVGTGVGRLSSTQSDLLPHSGEQLLSLLQGLHLTNTLLLVMGRPSLSSSVPFESLQRHRQHRLRLLVQVARLLVKDHIDCTRDLTHSLHPPPTDLSTHPDSDHPVLPTFLTEVDGTDAPHEETAGRRGSSRPLTMATDMLPTPPALYPRLEHNPRQSHYLHIKALAAVTTLQPPSPPTAPDTLSSTDDSVWDLDALRVDMMRTLSMSASTPCDGFIASTSLLCKLFHLEPALPQEEAQLIPEAAYQASRAWLAEAIDAGPLPRQLTASLAAVRAALQHCYLLHMKVLHPRFCHSEVERMARQDAPHVGVRLLGAAVAAVLGWETEGWEDVRGYLGGWRAVAPRAEFAEFEVPEVTRWSPKWATVVEGGSPYRHGRVGGGGMLGGGGGTPPGSGEGEREGGGGYGWYRSDVWAHLLGVEWGWKEGVRARVEGVLMEGVMQLEEIGKLDGGEGWRGLVEWLVLAVRCERMWRVASALFTEETMQAGGPHSGE